MDLTLTAMCHIRQYLDVILKAWGDWDLFQTLLRLLRDIADRHGGVSIANVAIRWVLEHRFVGAVLIGIIRPSTVPVGFFAAADAYHNDLNQEPALD